MDFCEFLGSLIYRGNPGQLGLCYTKKPYLEKSKKREKMEIARSEEHTSELQSQR